MKLHITLLIILCLSLSCSHESGNLMDPYREYLGDNIWHLDEEMTAPEEITVDGFTFRLETELWRDFMPISPPDGKPLIAIAIIAEINSVPIIDRFEAVKLLVAHEDMVWETEFTDQLSPNSNDHILWRIARKGPLWGPEIYVDVFVEFRDISTNETYLIKAADQYIEITW